MGLENPLRDRIRDHVNRSPHAPAVVVSGHITGLAVVRSLGRRDIPAVVLDRAANGVAFASRHTTATGLVPNPQTETDAFIDRLIEVGEALDRQAVLYPTNDDWLLAILRHADRLRPYYHIPFPDHETVDRILDKTRLYEEVRRLGIALPESHVLHDHDWETVRDAIEYPVIFKPAHQRAFYDAFGVKVYRIDDAETLTRVYEKTRPHKVLVQEIVPPEAATFLSLGSLVGRDGSLRAAFVGAKREQYPAGFGTACLVDSADAPEVIEEGGRLLGALGYHGVSELEYIHDARDGVHKVIDLNTRVWKWIGLPIAAGVDLPWLTYAEATGTSPDTQPAPPASGRSDAPVLPRRHVRWVHAQDYIRLRTDLAGHGTGTPTVVGDAQWAALFGARNGEGPTTVDAVLDSDDPAPAARLVQNLLCAEGYYCPC